MARSKVYSITSEEFKELVNNSKTLKEILEGVGIACRGHSYDILKKRLIEEGIDFSTKHVIRKQIKYDDSINVFVQNSTYLSTKSIKNKLISLGYKEYKCVKCGNIGENCGEKLTLQLDHINGIHNDNRIENLRFLCPNCHSQTPTYGGKNSNSGVRFRELIEVNTSNHRGARNNNINIVNQYCIHCNKIIWNKSKTGVCFICRKNNKFTKCLDCMVSIKKDSIHQLCRKCYDTKHMIRRFEVTKEELEILVTKHPMSEIGKMFGVSDTSVKKRCIKLGINIPPMRGYWTKIKYAKPSKS